MISHFDAIICPSREEDKWALRILLANLAMGGKGKKGEKGADPLRRKREH